MPFLASSGHKDVAVKVSKQVHFRFSPVHVDGKPREILLSSPHSVLGKLRLRDRV